MAIMMVLSVPDGTLDQYDQATREVFGGTLQPDHLPEGLLSHAAAESDDGILVVDVWTSHEAFDAFTEVLVPALKAAGIGDAQPRFYEVHNMLGAGVRHSSNA